MRVTTAICVALIVTVFFTSSASAKRTTAPQVPLTPAGQKLSERYTRMLNDLRAELIASVPFTEERKQALPLLKAEAKKQKKSSLPSIDAGLTKGEKDEFDDLLAKLEKKPEEPKASVKKGDDKTKPVLAFLRVLADEAKEEPHSPRSKAFAKVMDKRMAQAAPLLAKLQPMLTSDKLDAKLAKFMVLFEATPHGLAAFAQRSKKHELLVEPLLADPDLMIRMALADGAKRGKYGRAMEIYLEIQNVSPRAKQGVLERLALATALEHATPIGQRNPAARPNAPRHIDPVRRYLHFEKAYLDGELDAGFKDLTVWDMRMVVNGYEPDWTLAWGREMLRNYRPDHIYTADYRWRYVAIVRTDVRYGSQYNKYDKPELHFFQNILMNGGVCGRRAFIGRFILRAFGVPTIARPQKGHASLAHWTPEGWVICLGGGWGGGWVPGRYGGGRDSDLNFLAVTQARMATTSYLEVKRALWVGAVMGEKRVPGLIQHAPEFWHGVAYYRQRAINEEAKAVALAAVGEDIAEANESKVKEKINFATITDSDRKIVVGEDGVITIPAVACSKPTNSTRKIKFMRSNLGGMQLHYSRQGKREDFEYTFESPAAGKYALTARIVTPSWRQHLSVTVNDAKQPIDIAMPHTVGYWDVTDPIEITLIKGTNVLRFARNHPRLKGVTIRDFTLTPLSGNSNPVAAPYSNPSTSLEPALVALLEAPVKKALEDKLAQASSRATLISACRELIREFPENFVLQKICLQKVVSLRGPEASSDLLAALGSNNKFVRRFAREQAAELAGDGVTQTWVEYLGAAQDGVRPEILRVLSARRDVRAVPAIRPLIEHRDVHTRNEALSALVALGDPDGLTSVVKATADSSPDVRKAAYLILASTPGAPATEALLTLAKNAKTLDANSVAVKHAFLRMSTGKVADAERVTVLGKLIALSRRADDKKRALPEIVKLRPIDGLRMARSLLKDPVIGEGAGGAAIAIAESLEPEDKPTIKAAVEVLRDVVKQTQRPETQRAAETFIYRYEPPRLKSVNPRSDEDERLDLEF